MRRIVLAFALLGLIGIASAPSEAAATSGRTYMRNVGDGPIARTFMPRLYYSNAFCSYIPGTGYGGY